MGIVGKNGRYKVAGYNSDGKVSDTEKTMPNIKIGRNNASK